ncbi:MAG: acetyl-CoA carboxylase biotin carboxyl carrier protein subunit [Bacteriovoracaceae bacterium]|nr:acetyl-CoA carboxylase biotin carboxyl carrier protein subunit [Bacteriovoracaceae bacterium]
MMNNKIKNIQIDQEAKTITWEDDLGRMKYLARFSMVTTNVLNLYFEDQVFRLTYAKGPQGEIWLKSDFKTLFFENKMTRKKSKNAQSAESGVALAPMPGKVLRHLQKTGASVKPGETILILEAMKMELPIKAEKNGILDLVSQLGAQVSIGDKLFEIK